MMRAIVLGTAAGGGFPQWNCNCAGCRRARDGDLLASSRTQSSVAVTADDQRWILLNASPDLPHQLFRTSSLHPHRADLLSLRHSPLVGVVLTGAEVDVVAGLLSLRERHAFTIWGPSRVLDTLDTNPIFAALDRTRVFRRPLPLDTPTALTTTDGSNTGLVVEAFSVPGKVPLYLEGVTANGALGRDETHTIGLAVSEGPGSPCMIFVPGCAAITPDLLRRIDGCALLLFDGTVWRDDELVEAGVGEKTGRRMGHIPVSGADGSIAQLARTSIGRRVFIHINNTNPVLLADSAEHGQARVAGWEIPVDGTEYVI